MQTKFPCRTCSKRSPTCHAYCEEYLAVTKQKEKEREQRLIEGYKHLRSVAHERNNRKFLNRIKGR